MKKILLILIILFLNSYQTLSKENNVNKFNNKVEHILNSGFICYNLKQKKKIDVMGLWIFSDRMYERVTIPNLDEINYYWRLDRLGSYFSQRATIKIISYNDHHIFTKFDKISRFTLENDASDKKRKCEMLKFENSAELSPKGEFDKLFKNILDKRKKDYFKYLSKRKF